MVASLQEIKTQLEDTSWDLLDKADAEKAEGRQDQADLLNDAEGLVMEAIEVLREVARGSA